MTQPKLITKRDHNVVTFEPDKITQAIFKAGKQTGEFDLEEAKRLTEDTLQRIEEHNDYENLTVEIVQDLVEEALLYSKHKNTAKAYILYREKRSQARRRDIFKYRLNLKPYEYPEL